MYILITNDDGIDARGLRVLTGLAEAYFKSRLPEGEELSILVCAPLSQCSAMSQRITITRPLELFPRDPEGESVRTFAVDGTPADCVKAALGFAAERKPDLVFSGINDGYNVGQDILYSGTVAAAMEALMSGIPAAAFSIGKETDDFYAAQEFFPVLMDRAWDRWMDGAGRHILNVNFPENWDRERWETLRALPDGHPDREAFLGDLFAWDCGIEKEGYYRFDQYEAKETDSGSIKLHWGIAGASQGSPGTDINAVQSGRIAVNLIRGMIM